MSNNKIAEKLLTIDTSSLVIGEYNHPRETTYLIYWDNENNTVFALVGVGDNISAEYKKETTFSEIIMAGEKHSAVIYCEPASISRFLDIKFSDLVKEVWTEEEFEKDRSVWKSLSQSYSDLNDWETEVIQSAGQGYQDFMSQERNNIIDELDSFLDNISVKLEIRLRENYFNYRDSAVLDLAVVNNVVCFQWDIDVNYYLVSFEEIKKLFETI